MKGNVGSSRCRSGDWSTAVVVTTVQDGDDRDHGGVVWTSVKGFEPQHVIIFSIVISIQIFLLAQFGSVWPT